jgi:hypothetical protein
MKKAWIKFGIIADVRIYPAFGTSLRLWNTVTLKWRVERVVTQSDVETPLIGASIAWRLDDAASAGYFFHSPFPPHS